MKPHEIYPNIAKACFLIALDNGGINRDRSEVQWRKDFNKWIELRPEPLLEIDHWIGTLNEEDLETVCCGEATDIANLIANSPVFTDLILNDYFNEVC